MMNHHDFYCPGCGNTTAECTCDDTPAVKHKNSYRSEYGKNFTDKGDVPVIISNETNEMVAACLNEEIQMFMEAAMNEKEQPTPAVDVGPVAWLITYLQTVGIEDRGEVREFFNLEKNAKDKYYILSHMIGSHIKTLKNIKLIPLYPFQALTAKDKQIKELKEAHLYYHTQMENVALQSALDKAVGILRNISVTDEEMIRITKNAEFCGMNTKLDFFGDCTSCRIHNNTIINFLASLSEQKPEDRKE